MDLTPRRSGLQSDWYLQGIIAWWSGALATPEQRQLVWNVAGFVGPGPLGGSHDERFVLAVRRVEERVP